MNFIDKRLFKLEKHIQKEIEALGWELCYSKEFGEEKIHYATIIKYAKETKEVEDFMTFNAKTRLIAASKAYKKLKKNETNRTDTNAISLT